MPMRHELNKWYLPGFFSLLRFITGFVGTFGIRSFTLKIYNEWLDTIKNHKKSINIFYWYKQINLPSTKMNSSISWMFFSGCEDVLPGAFWSAHSQTYGCHRVESYWDDLVLEYVMNIHPVHIVILLKNRKNVKKITIIAGVSISLKFHNKMCNFNYFCVNSRERDSKRVCMLQSKNYCLVEYIRVEEIPTV